MQQITTEVETKTLRKYLEQFDRRDDILRGLGIIGWDLYERAIETFLLTGGSILLVGSHGEGKTMLAKKLGAALGVSMAKYDASKNVWEDIIGFPDPARLMSLENRGKTIGIPRIETPTSIWGKRLILVDEINRACYDKETQVLTSDGWKYFPELQTSDKIACYNAKTNMVVFDYPSKLMSYYVEEDLYEIKNDNVDVMVTGEHRMWAKCPEYKIVEAKDLDQYDEVMFMDRAEFNSRPNEKYFYLYKNSRGLPIKEWLKFLGYYINRGSCSTSTVYEGHLEIITYDEEHSDFMNILNKLGFSYKYWLSFGEENVRNWYIYGSKDEEDPFNKDLVKWITSNIGEHKTGKRIARELFNLSKSYRSILLSYLVKTNGLRNGEVYRAYIPRLADDVQELAYSLGMRTRYYKLEKPNPLVPKNYEEAFFVEFSKEPSLGYRVDRTDINKVPYKGKVYCATVDTGLLVTRRNGKITIQGNSPEMQSKWLEVILDQTLMGEPTGTKWIVSAMNPGYAGTNPLDLALVSRYMFFIQAPLGVKMPNEDLLEVLSLENPEEAPAFMTWANRRIRKALPGNPSGLEVSDDYTLVSEDAVRRFIEASNKLKAIMIIAADEYPTIYNQWNDLVNEYIVDVVKTIFNETKFSTDTRRIRMMRNAILASIALESPVRDISSTNIPSLSIQDIALQVLYMSYPVVAGIEGPERTQLENAHLKAQSILEDRHSPIYAISLEADPINKLILLFSYKDREPILTYKTIEEALRGDGGCASWYAAYALLAAYQEGLPLDAQVLTILNDSLIKISDTLFNRSGNILVNIGAKEDQSALQNIFKLSDTELFYEKVAEMITLHQLNPLSDKTRKFSSVQAFMDTFNESYAKVLNDLQDAYSRLKSVIPIAIEAENDSYED
jgi:hypothetical protein